MLLVQKPPTFNHSPAVGHYAHHRRNPSAPAVVVLPTKTPGLLSISKPQKQMPAQQRRQPPKKAPAQAQLNPTPKKTPSPAKDKKRFSSPSPVRGRHTRQPSPPVEAPIQSQQAEVPIQSHNQFDPFTSSEALPISESIPVPTIPKPTHQKLSRSAPKPTNMAPRPPRIFNFPVCDDDLSEPDSAGVPTPPATPMRKNTFSDKDVSGKVRRHRRAPSEGVFSMSSDDELSAGSDDELSAGSEDMNQFLFGIHRHRRPPVTPASSFSRSAGNAAARELNGSPASGQKGTGFFASSIFQNSPSPDELPNPLLF